MASLMLWKSNHANPKWRSLAASSRAFTNPLFDQTQANKASTMIEISGREAQYACDVKKRVRSIGSTDRLGSAVGLRTEGSHWYALHTFSNQEKRVEQHLRMKDIEVFLPLYTVTKRWKNRTTNRIELPLFTGYLFVNIAAVKRVRVLEIPSVVSIVSNGREPLALPSSEIETLRAGLHAGQIDPHPYLKIGSRARIRSGALAGLEGIVIRKDDHLKVVVSIDSILRSFAVHVQADDLEPCA
jgi:transcription antitermination factor NusG